MGDQIRHALQGRLLLAQLGGELAVEGGQGRERLDFGGQLFEVFVGQQIAQSQRAGNGAAKFTGVARFGKVLVGGADQAQDGIAISMAGEHQAHGMGMAGEHLAQQLGAVHARHGHIGDDHFDRDALHKGQRRLAAFGEVHVPVLAQVAKLPLQALQQEWFIINKKDTLHGLGEIGRRRMKVVPRPISV